MTDPTVSVVVPVKDGERHLEELLAALRRERVDEVLVIDSGSHDRSVAIARAQGAEVLDIPPSDFGHGRTRNLGAERTRGELIAFLTQDATPLEGWRAAFVDAMGLDPRVGAAYGPHLPRPETSPMIARELTEFFDGFSPDGRSVVQGPGDPTFLSNVNACYRRGCWEEVRFRDLPYSEDQAFGRDLLAAGWLKAYAPAAGVLHAHDYGPVEFMRRYFDEYRGLREATGHVEPLGLRSAPGHVRALVARDRRLMAERGYGWGRRAAWSARAALHHGGRRAFAALGSRAERLPASLQRAISLEGRAFGDATAGDGRVGPTPRGATAGDEAPAAHEAAPRGTPVPAAHVAEGADAVTRVIVGGGAPLRAPVHGLAERPSLHVATIVPPFRRGSGGHGTIFKIVSRLESMGHTCSVWVDDPFGTQRHEREGVLRRLMVEEFVPLEGPLFKGFDAWYGADVVMATGWQTVYPAMTLDACRARAYMVNDHEPEFYPTSIEARWAEQTYRLGLHCVSASRWLRDLLHERYGARGGYFQLGVDHSIYRPLGIRRRPDTVVFYARQLTPRRAVGLGLLALHELRRRRPDVRVVMFGDSRPLEPTFDYEHLGIATPSELARVYAEGTVGLCLSLTNYSIVPKEMLACGLPCVEVAGGSAEADFGSDGPLELADADPVALAEALERLLDDPRRWRERSEAGIEFVREHSWDLAAAQVEAELREALRRGEAEAAAAPALPTS
jgi:glycosyltransferase involved in cell wall biosynthesis